ncbi:hypothetical protein BKN38_06905 [Helicobacter sp. CLO-3]|uniref:ATP-binding cassette domain-containing protein n=1 Tax=unclassified Helicobacter TaxID=2593540 RepID=UPI00080577F3|nr:MULTISPECIES: ABC transporter ATP-binding protein [unclassified Helicobacter]OBV28620.1 hypothetical protein BA723_01760 [Helicobacter sp. CLO-3]OHU82499.1 hypothetical protein BKN38_06905 [Helicobacter sp. CLO-3]
MSLRENLGGRDVLRRGALAGDVSRCDILARDLDSAPILSLKGVGARFGDFALSDISFDIAPRERVGIIGESGSGKSLLAKLILGLARPSDAPSGEILFRAFGGIGAPNSGLESHKMESCKVDSSADSRARAKDISVPAQKSNPQNLNLLDSATSKNPASKTLMSQILGAQIAYIPQSPLLALNPLHSIQKQILEMFALHRPYLAKSEQECLLDEALARVGLEPSIKHRLPHTLSGGQAQRVCIAMMSILRPRILICDEPTTALDAHIQKQILALLDSFADMAIIFISHDLALMRHFASRLLVMKSGKIIDRDTTSEFFEMAGMRDSAVLAESAKLDSVLESKNKSDSKDKLESSRALESSDTAPAKPKARQLDPYTRLLLDAIHLRPLAPLPLPRKVLELKDFGVVYKKKGFLRSTSTRAISGINFTLQMRENVGIIGESGSGKSSLALGILGLEEHIGEIFCASGEARSIDSDKIDSATRSDSAKTDSQKVDSAILSDSATRADLEDFALESSTHQIALQSYPSKKRDKAFKRFVQIVFQDPLLALNPRMCVFEILQEALELRGAPESKPELKTAPTPPNAPESKSLESKNIDSARQTNTSQKSATAPAHIAHFLQEVGLDSSFLYRYPESLSGGQAQRVCIARALASGARVIILDEPTSALDKSAQKAILGLLHALQQRLNLSYILISHDLGVIESMCSRVCVLKSGRVVEQGAIKEVFGAPKDAYTRQLLEARI